MKTSEVQKISITSGSDREELTCVKGYGVFTIFVEDADHPDTGASAIFNIAANSSTSSVQKACSATGADGESLAIIWTPGARPALTFSGRVLPEFLPKHYIVVCGSLEADRPVKNH